MTGVHAGEIDRFVADGFIAIRGADDADVVRACREVIHAALRARGIDPEDPSTWTEPVVRLPCPEGPSFAAAGTSPAPWSAYEALLGAEQWVRRRGVGGTLPIRFPSERDPGDAGWHIDGSYDVDGAWWVNVGSRGRGLLTLFLFSDVGDRDAPTEALVGSHLDVPHVLAQFGDRRAVRPGREASPDRRSSARARVAPDAPATCSSVIRSRSIARRGRIAASVRGSSPNPRSAAHGVRAVAVGRGLRRGARDPAVPRV